MCPGAFEKLLNFRDVGHTINSVAGFRMMKEGVLFRSSRPDTATPKDRDLLTTQFRIKTIIDLRSETEHINAAKARTCFPPAFQPSSTASDPASPTPSLEIPGIHYHYINLNGPAFEHALLWKLSWLSIARLLTNMTVGRRVEAIAILGVEVMQPRGLTGLGCDTLDCSVKEIKRVFDVLADKSQYPVMVHCTQGKDRTGLVILLVLLLCCAPIDAITKDYVMSERELDPELDERMKEIRSIGLNEEFAGCPQDFVRELKRHLDERYGGLTNYLEGVGVDQAMQQNVRDFLQSQQHLNGLR